MSNYSAINGAPSAPRALLEPRLADDVEAERAIFVAQADDGEFTVDCVFDLDDLVLRRGDIRDVGNNEAARNLLLDRNACDGVLLLRGEPGDRRADAEMADAKQALDEIGRAHV